MVRPAEGSPAAWPWVAVAASLMLPALALGGAWSEPLCWSRTQALSQPWRLWSAAWVHLHALHLGVNLAGAVLVVALGLLSQAGARAALAWALAWPLTHAALALQPEVMRYGGLSGVLHAGVAVALVVLLRDAQPSVRRLGLWLAAGLLLKLLLEAPWQGALRWDAALQLHSVPWAHTAGALAGGVLAWLMGAGRADAASTL
jgi:rhomboid family GlyGly-CTERM serine protease